MKLYNIILFCFGLQYSSDNTGCSLSFLKRSWFSYSKVSTSVVVSVLSTVVKGSVLTVVSSSVLIAVTVSVLTAVQFQY